MGFFGELKKLTQPFDDEDDFYDGSDESFKAPAIISDAQKNFENSFASVASSSPAPADDEETADDDEFAPRGGKASQGGSGFLGALTGKKASRPFRERTVNFNGADTQVVLFNPKSFEESGELVSHMNEGRSVVMTLEGVSDENARRLLDFMSGIAFALHGKITPVSARTYFVTPQNVDFVGAQGSFGSGL